MIYSWYHSAPIISTPFSLCQKIVTFADIHQREIVYDLGCGDGKIVFAATEKGVQATGIEVSPFIFK